MTSILLNSLSDTNNMDNIYNTNIENNIKRLEREQAYQRYSNPEYLNQFDELKFDNIYGPVSINQSNKTGINNSLQRNIDFVNGYSEFQKNDMHYNVVGTNDFVHNNMIPNTSTRDRDNICSSRNQRTLETFTGNSDYYTPKTEQYHLFEPMADLSWTTGMPSITPAIENRYIPSNKNNYGNLPFQTNVRVKPGIENKNQGGNYAVYRINPLNIDQLRSHNNQKISYENKPLETVKKGEIRGINPVLSKFKMPDFREQKFSDLVASKSVFDGPIQTGDFTNMLTLRNETQNYNPGPAKFSSMGDGPDLAKTKFEDSKRESYLNDSPHAINAVNTKLVMTNINSYTNYETQRASTNSNYEGHANNNQKGYTIDYKDVPLVTQRQLLIDNPNKLGVSSQTSNNYIFSNDMVLPITNRNTLKTHDILGSNPQEKQVNTHYQDDARTTGRMFTSHNITGSSNPQEKQVNTHYQDDARTTGRMFTSHNITGTSNPQEKQVNTHYQDDARTTGRMFTSHNITGTSNPQEKQVNTHYQDDARTTGRMFTSHNITGTTNPQEKQVNTHYQDDARTTGRMFTSHNITGTSNPQEKQVNTHYQDDARTTGRMFTSHNITGTSNPQEKQVNTHYQDDARTTGRMFTSHNITGTSNPQEKQVNTHYQDDARTTGRMFTSHNITGSSNPQEKQVNTHYQDDARTTIKQTTLINDITANISNINNTSNYTRDENDIAKITIRQQIEDTQNIGGIKSAFNDASYVIDNNYIAKITTKETTIAPTPLGREYNPDMGSYTRDEKDEARETIKQTIINNNYIGGIKTDVEKKISHEATDNIELDDRREISTFNRPANGKKDLHGPYINKENVELNEPLLYSFVPIPHKTLDQSIMPTVPRNLVEKVYIKAKPVIETSSYYINNNFINTLADNPLVNDLYHQKNIKY